MGLKAILKTIPGIRLLQGGWPDEARGIIQRPVFERLLRGREVRGNCLNAGCGEGLFVQFLENFRNITRIVHMDLKMPALTHFAPDPRREAVEGSLVDLPFKDGEFDFVFCTEVLEHIVDDSRAFLELGRVLKPNGLTLVSTPTPPAPYDPAHVREGYTLDELRKRLAAARVEVVDHAYCFHAAMRMLLRLWRWQYELAGRQKSWMPRAAVLGLGYCDRWFPLGKPFDVAVLGRKML